MERAKQAQTPTPTDAHLTQIVSKTKSVSTELVKQEPTPTLAHPTQIALAVRSATQ